MAYDVVIKGGRIYDGSGLPSYFGDVAINGDRIVEVGRINDSARRVVNAEGLAVSPGFIDFHGRRGDIKHTHGLSIAGYVEGFGHDGVQGIILQRGV